MIRERGEAPKEAPPRSGVPSLPQPISPINWWKLDDEERREVLELLSIWVPELVRRYALTETVVPPCWYQHEPLIQELLALYQYRNQNQFLPVAPPVAPKEFHYELQLAIGRLRGWVMTTQCNAAEHNDDRIQHWAAEGSSTRSLWQVEVEEFIGTQSSIGWLSWSGASATPAPIEGDSK